MSILTIISLIATTIKVVSTLADWLGKHPDITAAVRSTVNDMLVQVENLEDTVDNLREAHSRVEAP